MKVLEIPGQGIFFFLIWMTLENRKVINISEYVLCDRIRIKSLCPIRYL